MKNLTHACDGLDVLCRPPPAPFTYRRVGLCKRWNLRSFMAASGGTVSFQYLWFHEFKVPVTHTPSIAISHKMTQPRQAEGSRWSLHGAIQDAQPLNLHQIGPPLEQQDTIMVSPKFIASTT